MNQGKEENGNERRATEHTERERLAEDSGIVEVTKGPQQVA